MKNITQRFEENYLLGCIKYNEKFDFYLMPIAWWILNHDKYDPDNKYRKSEFEFRDDINNVLDEKVPQFLKSIEVDKLRIDELRNVLNEVNKDYTFMYFLIDFDDKIFISAFPDIEVEDYLPDKNWKGMYANPVEKLPKQLKEIFEKKYNN